MHTVTIRDLRNAIRDGTLVGSADPGSPTHVVDAEVLRQALLEDATQVDHLWLRGIRVQGSLSLLSAKIGMRVWFDDCHFDHYVDLTQAEIPEVAFRSCRFDRPVLAHQLAVRWNLDCQHTTFRQGVLLDNCTIDGTATFSHGTFLAPRDHPYSLSLGGAKIGGACLLRRAYSSGELLMIRAEIREHLSLVDANIVGTASGEVSLSADGISIAGGMFLNGLRSRGEIRLTNAQVGGRMMLTEARLEAPSASPGSHDALVADGISIAADLMGHSIHAKGELRLPGAVIEGQFTLNGGRLQADGPRGVALHLDRAEVAGGAFLRNLTSDGELRFLGLKCGGQVTLQEADVQAFEGALPSEDAISFDSADIADGLFLDHLKVIGIIRFPGLSVGGNLSMDHARLRGSGRTGVCVNGEGCSLKGDLFARNLEVKGSLVLRGAKIDGHIAMRSASVEAFSDIGPLQVLVFDRAEVAGGVNFEKMRTYGEVRLSETHIRGQLLFSDARVQAFAGGSGNVCAFSADSAVIDGPLICTGLRSFGHVRMVDATINGPLWLSGAFCEGAPNKPSLTADGSRISDLICPKLQTRGAVQLLQVRIEGQVNLEGAKLEGWPGERRALTGDGLNVGRGMFCTGLRSKGGIAMYGAEIRKQLSFIGVELSAQNDPAALVLTAAELDELILAPREITGTVDLRHARTGTLWDAENDTFAGKFPRRLRLEGFQYGLREPLDAKHRLQWVKSSQEDRYIPGVYAELANAFRKQGHSAAAREIAIAGERQGRQRFRKFDPGGLWQDTLWLTIGYGYRNWLAGVWLLGLVLLGGVAFTLGEDSFHSANPEPPPFDPFLFAVDATVPILDVGQQRAWNPDGFEAWLALFLAVSGYALATAVIAAATGLFNRETSR